MTIHVDLMDPEEMAKWIADNISSLSPEAQRAFGTLIFQNDMTQRFFAEYPEVRSEFLGYATEFCSNAEELVH